jgi:hypothetical protein
MYYEEKRELVLPGCPNAPIRARARDPSGANHEEDLDERISRRDNHWIPWLISTHLSASGCEAHERSLQVIEPERFDYEATETGVSAVWMGSVICESF